MATKVPFEAEDYLIFRPKFDRWVDSTQCRKIDFICCIFSMYTGQKFPAFGQPSWYGKLIFLPHSSDLRNTIHLLFGPVTRIRLLKCHVLYRKCTSPIFFPYIILDYNLFDKSKHSLFQGLILHFFIWISSQLSVAIKKNSNFNLTLFSQA